MSSLALGLGFFILFALISDSFKNYDTFHNKADRIFSIVQVLPGGIEGEQHSARMTLFISFITVISLTLKAAYTNPVNSLRYEQFLTDPESQLVYLDLY